MSVAAEQRQTIDLRIERLNRTIVKLSIPSVTESVLITLVYLVSAALIGWLNDPAALATHQITIRVESLAFMPGWGLATAAAALVGQALGAQKEDVAELGIRRTLLMGNGIMALLGAVFVVLGPAIIHLFGVQDAELVNMAALVVRISALELFGLCSVMIIGGCLRGAGDTRTPMIVTLAGTLLFRVPTTYLFAITLDAGLKGVWLATTVDWSMRALIMFFLYMRGHWKTVTV